MYMLVDDYSDCPWIVDDYNSIEWEDQTKVYGMRLPDYIVKDAIQRANDGCGVDQNGDISEYDIYYFDSDVIDKYNTYIVHKLFRDFSFQEDFCEHGWEAYLLSPYECPDQGFMGRCMFRNFLIDLAEKGEIEWSIFRLHDIPGIKIWKQEDENE